MNNSDEQSAYSIRPWTIAVVASVLVFAIAMMVGPVKNVTAQPAEDRGYVTAAVCADCHKEEAKAWRDSHHGWALRRPTAENVLGDFNNKSISHKGLTTRFLNRDGKFIIETHDADGKTAEFDVKFTVGVEPLQQYLLATGKGRLQVFDVAWDTENKRWFHVFPDQNAIPGDGLHWTGPYKNWQSRCAECHQTGFVKAYNPRERSYSTRWADDTVGCESCHGPGGRHVAWAKDPQNYDVTTAPGHDKFGLSVSFANKRQQTELNVCGRCHSRREPLGADSPPENGQFDDHYNLSLLRRGLYHSDGQVNDEVYVLGSFLQSKMQAKGVTCTNCHEAHSLELKADGNAVCTQCHSETGNDQFPSLTKKLYDSKDHHFHDPGSEASQCVSCHMPEKNFMVVDGRHDHSFRIPRPDISQQTGAPNACTSCHDDKSDEWADEALRKWYPNGRSGKPHFASSFSAAQNGNNNPATMTALFDIAEDLERPAIVRASALELARASNIPDLVARAAVLLNDKEPLVRRAAASHFRRTAPQSRLKLLVPLLSDPKKTVRVAAARELSGIALGQLDEDTRKKVMQGGREFQRSLFSRADFPETQMAIAGLAMSMRNMKVAKSALSEALEIDPQLAEAWRLKARIELAERNPQEARKTLEAALEKLPESPALHLSLARTMVQLGADKEALGQFEATAELLQDNVSVHLEWAATLTRLGRNLDALRQAKYAQKIAPENPTILALIAVNQLQLGQLVEARESVRKLTTRYPQYQLTPQLDALKTLP